MTGRIFNNLLPVVLSILLLAVASYIAYRGAVEKGSRNSLHESEWIDEIGSSKCGSYTKYGSVNIDLVSREMACRQTLTSRIHANCSMERDQWYSVFSTRSDGARYRDCMLNLGNNL